MIKSSEELIAQLKSLIGDEMNDDAISLVENIADTVAGTDAVKAEAEKYKAERDAIDKEWRDKYVARFEQGAVPPQPQPPKNENDGDNDEDIDEMISIDDLEF